MKTVKTPEEACTLSCERGMKACVDQAAKVCGDSGYTILGGRSSLHLLVVTALVSQWLLARPGALADKITRMLLIGNRIEWNGKAQAFYDLFRIQDGKIIEHWDIIQEIPSEMPHENGMF